MSQEIEHLKQHISNLNEVRSLAQSKGWVIIKEHFQIVLEKIFDEIIFGKLEEKEILQRRERYRAFKSMLETVDALCKEHSEAIERLQEMELQQRESEQYGLDS